LAPIYQGKAQDGGSRRWPAACATGFWPRALLPWLGGYLICVGADVDFAVRETDDRSLAFTLAGKRYRLPKSEIRS